PAVSRSRSHTASRRSELAVDPLPMVRSAPKRHVRTRIPAPYRMPSAGTLYESKYFYPGRGNRNRRMSSGNRIWKRMGARGLIEDRTPRSVRQNRPARAPPPAPSLDRLLWLLRALELLLQGLDLEEALEELQLL